MNTFSLKLAMLSLALLTGWQTPALCQQPTNLPRNEKAIDLKTESSSTPSNNQNIEQWVGFTEGKGVEVAKPMTSPEKSPTSKPAIIESIKTQPKPSDPVIISAVKTQPTTIPSTQPATKPAENPTTKPNAVSIGKITPHTTSRPVTTTLPATSIPATQPATQPVDLTSIVIPTAKTPATTQASIKNPQPSTQPVSTSPSVSDNKQSEPTSDALSLLFAIGAPILLFILWIMFKNRTT